MSLPWLEEPRARLAASLADGRLGHAPLIAGPVGVGKQQLATWLVQRILCLDAVDVQPCGRCRSCELLAAGTHPDQFAVGIPEDKKEIPVDSIRELSASLQLTPRIGPHRLGWIEPAEAMNRNAANALLKTLEEPAAQAWLVLVSHRPGRLPATVRSRCQPITIRPPELDLAMEWLGQQCPGRSEIERAEALALSAGAPLAAASLLADEGMALGHTILEGLLVLRQGAAVSTVLRDEWLAAPLQTWRWLALWTHRALLASHGSELRPGQRAPEGLPACAALARLWEQALHGGRLVEANARQELLLGKWLLEWKASPSGN